METVSRGITIRACGNFSLANLTNRRVSLMMVSAVCSLRQLLMPMVALSEISSGVAGGGGLAVRLVNNERSVVIDEGVRRLPYLWRAHLRAL